MTDSHQVDESNLVMEIVASYPNLSFLEAKVSKYSQIL
jgi:hypothetical protein